MSFTQASIALGAVLLFSVTACDQKALLKKFTPDAEDLLARRFIDEVRLGHTDEAGALLDVSLRNSEGFREMGKLVTLFAAGEVKSIEVVGAFQSFMASTSGSARTVSLTYELHLSNGWFAGTVVILEKGGSRKITSATFSQNPSSLAELNAFTAAVFGLRHLLFLVGCAGAPLLSVWALVRCIRSRVRRKWLWIIFIILGVVTFRLNWTTGQMSVQFLSVQLFGFGVLRMGVVGPWILSFALPLGAVVFLNRRKALTMKTPPELAAASDG